MLPRVDKIEALDSKNMANRRMYTINEPRHEKTGFLHMRKQTRRSASR